MENDTYFEPTIFDTITQSREIEMLKTAIPYMKQSQKRQFAILIKYLELQRAAQIFSVANHPSMAACELPETEKSSFHMLNDIRKYATPKEQEMIDSLSTLFSMMSLYSEVM